jgi:DnaA family protein
MSVETNLTVPHPLSQLTLGLEPKIDVGFEHFIWGSNLHLKNILESLHTDQPIEKFIYLWGEPGSGKSHLLQACCHSFSAQKPVVYLPLKHHQSFEPEILSGLEHSALVAIDDVDMISGHPAWEEALFHLINRIRQNKQAILVLSSNFSPQSIQLKLPDLKSRLHLGLCLAIQPLDDQCKFELLQAFASRRGFAISPQVAEFLMNHYHRHMGHLIELIKTLDHASLSAKRKITIPFIKTILGTTPHEEPNHGQQLDH